MSRDVSMDHKQIGEDRGGGVKARRQGYEPQSRWRWVNEKWGLQWRMGFIVWNGAHYVGLCSL